MRPARWVFGCLTASAGRGRPGRARVALGADVAASVLATAVGCGEAMVSTAMLLTGAVVFANVLFNKD